ncbi:MAG TPA: branched-chain amino acid ABC transporter permease [Burkholderiales bacterium]|nr:branched-chain amino acid ABC transporter permease [Burkholderiales bacterium]
MSSLVLTEGTAGAGSIASLNRTVLLLAGGLLLTLVPLALFSGDQFWLNILVYTYLFAGLSVAWNIIAGFGGQFSLGHGVFFAVGAYTTARLYLIWGISPWLALIPGALLCALIGPLIFWPTFRLKGSFFAIATLAFNEVAFVLANYFETVTGGPRGLQIPFRASLGNMIFEHPLSYAVLMFAFMAICIAISVWIRRSRLGYYLLAVREDEDAARAAGIDVAGVKLRGTAVSAALSAIGGALFAMYVRTIDPPTLFSLTDVGFKFALLALIGGIGTISGPVLGAFLIIPVESWLRAELGGGLPGMHLAILGGLMLLAALFMRRGLAGLIATALARRRERSKGGP